MFYQNFAADETTSASVKHPSRVAFAIGDADHLNFGGGTVTLEGRVRGGNGSWFPITDASWTAITTGIMDTSPRWDLRVKLAGSTSPDLTISIEQTVA